MKHWILTISILILGSTGLQAQTVTTYAGVENTTSPETDVDNTQVGLAVAHFYEPQGIAWDSDGNMYITERNKIRMVYDTLIHNRSGNQGDATFSHGYVNGTGNAAAYFNPTSAVCDGNRDVFIVDTENHAIRKLTKFGSIGSGQMASTFAGAAPDFGSGTSGTSNGTGTNARFNTPKGITRTSDGNFYVTDFANHTVRKITSAGAVTTLAGQAGTPGSDDDVTGSGSTLFLPYGIAVLDQNHVVITDYGNFCVRKINVNTGQTTTIAGAAGSMSIKDGTLAEARFRAPRGIAVVNGLIYVADENVIRVIDIANNSVSTFAGDKTSQANKDGVGAAASFGRVGEVAYDGGFSLYVTDIYYNIVKKITIDDLKPVADFTATKVSLEVDETTVLTDVSTGATTTSRTWTITDVGGSSTNVEIVSGDPFSSASLTVRFKATGFYTVKLAIVNDFGSDVVTKNSYINVSVTGAVSSVSEEEMMQLFPNPASTDGYVTVSSELLADQNAAISITDMQGRVVHQQSDIRSSQVQIPLSGFRSGFYFIEIRSEKAMVARKFAIR